MRGMTLVPQQHLVCVAADVQRLQLALEGVVLSVQGMLLRVGAGLDHLHRDLNVTEGLGEERCHHSIALITVKSDDVW